MRDYDQTCKEDADCVAVKDGDICCGCPNAAINKSDHQRYKDDLGTCAAVCEIACTGDDVAICDDTFKCALKAK